MSSARANIRARAARACTVLAEAGERTYGRVAGATRAPFSTAAANLRLLSKIHVKLPRPTLSGAKKRSPPVGAEQPQAPTPTTSADLAPTPVPGSRPSRLTGAQLMSRGRSALRGGLRAAAKAARKPPRAALGVVRAVARRKKGEPSAQQDSPGEPSSSTIVTTDRDIMKKELKKVTRERDDAVSRLNAVSQSDQPANYGTLGKHGVSVSDKSLSTPRDYESIKLQCEKAMAEVQGLLKQNVDLTRKYENCMKEVDYYKKQERAAYTALQNLRMQYEEVVAEKQKLEREVTSLQTIMEDDRKEIADLRRQQQVSNLLVRAFSIVDGASQN